tara:strand:+ start:5808 stop:6131 length:324 start_codon:yes stop_codon:yes gene_type:complete
LALETIVVIVSKFTCSELENKNLKHITKTKNTKKDIFPTKLLLLIIFKNILLLLLYMSSFWYFLENLFCKTFEIIPIVHNKLNIIFIIIIISLLIFWTIKLFKFKNQ